MSQPSFRFLHTADLHLDRPIEGVADAPDSLVDLLVDSPMRAAARLFDAAIDQRVDFVVVAGDALDPRCCAPRDLLFLADQFQRLEDRKIAVYWATGASDSVEHWPLYLSWPGNVHFFPRGQITRRRHEISGLPVCEILGFSHDQTGPPKPYQFAPGNSSLFTIAVAHVDWNAGAVGEIGIDYWALGGAHNRSTPLETRFTAHFAGSPQGRSPLESGHHGCTLVAVDQQRRVRLTPLPCDVVRWIIPRLSLDDHADSGEMERLLRDRSLQLAEEAPGVALLITWKIACQGPLSRTLRLGGVTTELLSKLRAAFAHRSTPLWISAIEVDLPEQMPPSWAQEDSIRGDYLRAIEDQLSAIEKAISDGPAAKPADPEHLFTPDELPARPKDAHRLPTHFLDREEVRLRALREAAWLGSDLLSPPEAPT